MGTVITTLLLTALAQGAPLAPSTLNPIAAPSGEARIAAWEDHRSRTEQSPQGAPDWRPLGPKNCGGRVEAVDSPKGKPGVIYAGIGSGGVWKSVNGGLSWRHVFANVEVMSLENTHVS